MFVNPKIFANADLVQINRIQLKNIDSADIMEYKKNIHAQLIKVFSDAIRKKQLTNDFYQNGFTFGKIIEHVFFNKHDVNDITRLIKKASKDILLETFQILKAAISQASHDTSRIFERIQFLESAVGIPSTIPDVIQKPTYPTYPGGPGHGQNLGVLGGNNQSYSKTPTYPTYPGGPGHGQKPVGIGGKYNGLPSSMIPTYPTYPGTPVYAGKNQPFAYVSKDQLHQS